MGLVRRGVLGVAFIALGAGGAFGQDASEAELDRLAHMLRDEATLAEACERLVEIGSIEAGHTLARFDCPDGPLAAPYIEALEALGVVYRLESLATISGRGSTVEIRRGAIEALVRMESPASLGALTDAYTKLIRGGTLSDRNAAYLESAVLDVAERLALVDDEDAREAARSAFHRVDRAMWSGRDRLRAIDGLWFSRPEVVELRLLVRLIGPDSMASEHAALLLGAERDVALESQLLALLPDLDRGESQAVVRVLGQCGSDASVETLVAFVHEFLSGESDEDQALALESIDALKEIGSPDAVRALVRIGEGLVTYTGCVSLPPDHPDYDYPFYSRRVAERRTAARRALVTVDDPRADETLWSYLTGEWHSRETWIALGAYGERVREGGAANYDWLLREATAFMTADPIPWESGLDFIEGLSLIIDLVARYGSAESIPSAVAALQISGFQRNVVEALMRLFDRHGWDDAAVVGIHGAFDSRTHAWQRAAMIPLLVRSGDSASRERVESLLDQPEYAAEARSALDAWLDADGPTEDEQVRLLVRRQDDEYTQRFERLAIYAQGASRVDLVALENAARGADEALRERLEAGYVALLDGEHTADARRFALRQLRLVGGEAAVPAIASVLTQDDAVHLACEALAAIGGDAARSAAAAAVAPSGEQRPEVTRLLGDLDHVAPLLGIAKDTTRPWSERAEATEQLARSADTGARAWTLDAYAWSFSPDLEGPPDFPSLVRLEDALLHMADRLDADDRLVDLATKGYELVDANTDCPFARMRAVAGLARLDPMRHIGRLTLLLASDDDRSAGFAARALTELAWDGTSAVVAGVVPELSDGARERALQVLTDRGDDAAFEALGGLARRGEGLAIDALAHATGRSGYNAIVGAMMELVGDDVALARARRALERQRDPQVDAWLSEDVRDESSYYGARVRIELIGAYGRRSGDDCIECLMAIVQGQRELGDALDGNVVRAAWRSTAEYAAGSDFELVAANVAGETAAIDEAGAALVATVERSIDPTTRRDAVLATYEAASPAERAAMMEALALVGGDDALAQVRLALADEALAPRAVAALARWRTKAALEPLLVTLATGGESLRAPAFDGAVELARRLVGSDLDGAGGVVRALWDQARDLDQRDRVLDLAAAVPGRASAAVVQLALDSAERRDSALDAAVRLAPTLGPQLRYVALDLLDSAATKASTAGWSEAITNAVDAVEAHEDHLLAWRLAGPYEKGGVSGSGILAEVFAPEIDPDDPAIQWRDLWPWDAPDAHGVFNLNEVMSGGDRTAYVRTHVWSDTAQQVRLELGSDDGLCVWLNGDEIHRNDVMRGLSRGSDVVLAKLEPGWNDLMLEISQGGGDWKFACRLRGVDRRAATGWRHDRFPRATAPPPGATVLLGDDADGTSAWQHFDGSDARWRDESGAMIGVPGTGNVRSRAEFGDASIHVEFRVPHEPDRERGQGQGNSGVYMQGRYEVQVLNSWGMPAHPNEGGSIYGVRAPNVNMSARPGTWQVYDIEFTAARWKDGEKISDARMTVFHNGVLVHDDVVIGGSTGAGGPEVEGRGPLVLQDHGHELAYRNVWVLPHDAPLELQGDRSLIVGDGLDGWVSRGGAAVYARDGDAIVGETRPDQPNTFLCTDRDFANFVLEYEYLVHPELNSGVQIRSQSRPDHMNGRVHGYQVEIDPSERGWSSGIYDEARRGWLAPLGDFPAAREAFQQGEWNRVRIYANGDVLRTWLNGQPCAVLVDGMTPSGFIGLQVHGVGGRQDPIDIRWRGMRILELD